MVAERTFYYTDNATYMPGVCLVLSRTCRSLTGHLNDGFRNDYRIMLGVDKTTHQRVIIIRLIRIGCKRF